MNYKEDILLAQCHIWLWNTHPETRYCAWHIANERHVPPAVAAQLRSKGVVSGVPDYVFNWHYKTTYFEFKSLTGKQTANQQLAQLKLQNEGFDYYIIKDLSTFVFIIESILKQ